MAALFRASEEGNLDNLKELSDRTDSIDLGTANKHGETAVHMAASGGHVDVLKFLQDKGVNISMKDNQGDTALYWAARQGHLEAIRCLQEAGLPLDSQNKSGETALHVAARYGHAHVVDFLCEAEANINVIDSQGETPLHSAAWHGYSSIVQSLCEHGAVLDMRNKDGESVLHCAAVRGNVDCVRILLDSDAPLNLLDKRGSTALHLSCQRQQTGIALMLLHAGCHMDSMDREMGESALHVACREGLTEVVDTMCELGCRLDTLSAEGFTPLHLAVKGGHIEVVRCLLMSGAPPETPNKDGLTGEIIALAQGYVDIAELLSKVKGDKGQALIGQLEESPHPLPRIKLKVLGSSGGGKSLLIESLKCGFLGSFFRRRLPNSTGSNSVTVAKGKTLPQFSLPTPMSYSVANPTFTKGVEIQQINIAGAGEFSVWDFAGYEPYYVLYDHLLGDTHCLHVLVFSLLLPPEEQLAQVVFWLNFLKARVPPALPIGYCGRLRNSPRVLLVATHADKAGCSRNSRGEYVSGEASGVHQKAQQLFRHDVRLADRLFVVDSQLAASPDLKALKAALGLEKQDIVQAVPKPSGLLEATVAQLASWRRENGGYPVLTWSQLADLVRSSVNPLASTHHVKLLAHHLELMGEIMYVESESSDLDLVVLDPRWLCADILGTLLSPHNLAQAGRAAATAGEGGGGARGEGDGGGGDAAAAAGGGGGGGGKGQQRREGGRLSVGDVQRLFPEVDALNLLQVFEALEVCTQCEVNGEVDFEFPCLNFMDPPEGLWQKGIGAYQDAVYGGVRLHTSFQSGAQLKYLFPRIQVFLRRNMLGDGEPDPERGVGAGIGVGVELIQWHYGSRYRWGQLEGLVNMDHHQQFLELKVRGPQDSRYALFFFLEDFVNVVEQVVERVCPGLGTERYLLSPSQLCRHGTIVRSYSPTELLRMQLENRSSVTLSGSTTEEFLDVACMGCEEVLQHVRLGLEQDAGQLSLHTQRQLSLLLDPPDSMGRDWCLLAVTLGLADYLPTLDTHDGDDEDPPHLHPHPYHHRHHRPSNTQRVLAEWARRGEASVRELLARLKDLHRLDAVEAVLRTTPAFRTLSYEDASTDESGCCGGGGAGGGGGGQHGTDTSTNTLLSR
ncbi:death-associated protein kinase 1-like [Babylonia areolata]|uniref:death-associated protein kinase 1-like n=1 Tax=Babylonia areolata TaxID=304850 RepID=UPI003FD4710D